LWTVIAPGEGVVPHRHIEFLSGGRPSTLIKKKEAPSQCGENHPEALFAANSVNEGEELKSKNE